VADADTVVVVGSFGATGSTSTRKSAVEDIPCVTTKSLLESAVNARLPR
jgi:hypothetical protein